MSEVGKTLIDHVARFIGGGLAPYQIKRITEAQAHAALIKATSDIHVQGLHQRAALRAAQEQTRHQHNMEAIALEGAKEVTESYEEKPDDDWLDYFFNHARHISSSEAQNLWGKILGNEFQKPGQTSKKLLDTLRSLDKHDAQLFQRICEFSIIKDGEPTPVILNKKDDFYANRGVTLKGAQDLEAVGLMHVVHFRLGPTTPPEGTIYELKVGKSALTVHTPAEPKPKSGLNLGLATFTKYGKELFRIVNIEPSDEFKEYLKNQILKQGYTISEPLEYDPAEWPDDKDKPTGPGR